MRRTAPFCFASACHAGSVRGVERARGAPERRTRPSFAARHDQVNRVLAKLEIEKAKIHSDGKVAEADLGPIR
jgi:hypothetical protein